MKKELTQIFLLTTTFIVGVVFTFYLIASFGALEWLSFWWAFRFAIGLGVLSGVMTATARYMMIKNDEYHE